MTSAQRFLAACSCKPVDRTPVWMMRQAGRYLPEYRAVRERTDFLTLCKSPQLAAEVSLQPIRRFEMDACIVFSDILIPVEAMGAPVAFTDAGPKLERPVRDMADVDALRVPRAEDAPYVLDTLRLLRSELGGETALVGFAGAPFTLASYLVEGGGSKTFASLKRLMYAEPATLHALLAKLAETIAQYCVDQVEAGAQAIQLFDTWAGDLTPRAYEHFALPYQRSIIARIKSCGVPAILFVNGSSGVLELMAQSGADVLSLDWRIDLGVARERIGNGCALQGNVDPTVLLSVPHAVKAEAAAALRSAGPSGHILNLGHGVLPATPLECVRAFIEAPLSA
ncbi:MAG: uroporphyrinogen decarboxylase [Candidatus Eremiobacter antarcticus]|nr:uroporphyrinogen decarboxylase [Candidatus Eremiobacteraeota bacterium]MBC5807643.1 uroporphyrinogen decarboxylase [Candidatus Eremiobacteraeota bacterium]PZR61309.1 MAG: uroporphyrinogen decarboxylase [Candidatus Eremiobacter sp. RRmetagenome_bin22]